MKRTKLLSLLMGVACVMLMSNFNRAIAQTDGTLTFTFTQAVPSGGTKNVEAIWIEDNAGAFVKTRMRFWSSGTNDHLPSWVTNSGQNVAPDAVVGATRTSSTTPTAFGAKTITWDGKGAVSGTTMPDGVYKVMIESSWATNTASGQHGLITSYTFTKGPVAEHLTPAGDANFSAITSDWVPTFTGVQTNEAKNEINVYPNPTNGIVNIDIKNSLKGTIKVENITGEIVFEENVDVTGSKVETIDLSKLANGNYFIKVQSSDSKVVVDFKIVLGK